MGFVSNISSHREERRSLRRQITFVEAALFTAAFAIVSAPGLAIAQAAPERAGGGAWVLPLIFGILLVAIVMFTRSQRRRDRDSKNR